jgi:hypothetical protein
MPSTFPSIDNPYGQLLEKPAYQKTKKPKD